jgi:hypothetical protein
MTSYTEWGYVFPRSLNFAKNVLGEVARTCSNWSKAYFTPFHAIAVNREQKIISTHVHASLQPRVRRVVRGPRRLPRWGCLRACQARSATSASSRVVAGRIAQNRLRHGRLLATKREDVATPDVAGKKSVFKQNCTSQDCLVEKR